MELKPIFTYSEEEHPIYAYLEEHFAKYGKQLLNGEHDTYINGVCNGVIWGYIDGLLRGNSISQEQHEKLCGLLSKIENFYYDNLEAFQDGSFRKDNTKRTDFIQAIYHALQNIMNLKVPKWSELLAKEIKEGRAIIHEECSISFEEQENAK
jgi:hypothetical protein